MAAMSEVFTDETVETAAKAAIGMDEPRALLDRFSTLVRESGTADEETAARFIVGRSAGARYSGDASHARLVHQRARAGRDRARRTTRREVDSGETAGHGPIDGRAGGDRRCVLRALAVRGRHDVAVRCTGRRAGRAWVDVRTGPGSGNDRADRGLLDAGAGAGLRAPRRRRADLHPSGRAHPRRHLHVHLGRAHARIHRPQAHDAGCVHQPARWRSRSSPS